MIGRVTNVGMIDYTASYDGEKIYLYEQSKLVAEREIKGITGVVFDGSVIYYTLSGNNTIFAETVLGHTLNNYTLKEFSEVVLYKKLSDAEFIIEAVGNDSEKVVIYNVSEGKTALELPCDDFHDFAYDGEDSFRISGHFRKDISVYDDDCDYTDIIYGEYQIHKSGKITKKCHFAVCEIEGDDEFDTILDCRNIVFSLFDNYLRYVFSPDVLTSSYIVSKCWHNNGFIIFEKTTGALKLIISLTADLLKYIEMYGFNEQTNVLTILSRGELHRFKAVVSDNTAIEELHNKYMTAYKADSRNNLRTNFDFDRLFYKAVESCEIIEIKD